MHERIKELLPEYLRNSLNIEIRSEVASHLKECEECSAELSLLAELEVLAVPDPGDAFWQNLPHTVLADSGKKEQHWFSPGTFFRPVLWQFPVAAALALLVLLVFSYMKKNATLEQWVYSSDPHASTIIDYSDIDEQDIVLSAEKGPLDEEYLNNRNFFGNYYYREIFSLNSDELASLNEILKSKGKGG